MYVCIGNSVTDREIKKAVKQGADTFEKVSACLNVGTCCGRCKSHAHEVIDDAHNEKILSLLIPNIMQPVMA